MAQKLRIGVVFGGRSGEHEVSLISAASVISALDRSRYDVVPIGIAPDGRWISSQDALKMLRGKVSLDREPERVLIPEPNRHALVAVGDDRGERVPLDVIFPVVHGTFGEDGSLQGLLELADVPYVGAGVLGSSVGMDKIVQKQLFERDGLPVPRYVWFPSTAATGKQSRVVAAIENGLRYPVFVKPANTGSSVGISKAHNRKELRGAIELATAYDRRIIVEQAIAGAREIEVSLLGNEEPIASVPGEIIPSNEFYDYDAKYVDGKSTAIIPARLQQAVVRKLQEYAIRAFRAIDCAGMARADFFVTRRTGRIYVNELNTIPGFTSISMYPKLWEASGIPYGKLLDRLIDLALERHRAKAALRRTYTPSRDWFSSEQ